MRRIGSLCAWSHSMFARICLLLLALGWLLGNRIALRADEIHRNDFSGKNTFFVKGDANVRVEEKAHDLSGDRSRSLPTSQHIRLNRAAGKNETNYGY